MADLKPSTGDLSSREHEVAEAYAAGQSYKEIARTLGVSPTTVRSHLRTIFGKLGVTSKIELAQSLTGSSALGESRDRTAMAADLALELDEAIRRERSLARVLRIISNQDGELDDVIDAVLDHALEICEAEFGILFEYQGDFRFRELRSRNISPTFADWLAERQFFPVDPATDLGRVAAGLRTVNTPDVRGEDVYQCADPLMIATAELGKARSFAAIPMMSGGRLIGAFTVYRTRMHPFNDRALELVQLFADQAVIAIENVRQFRELQFRLQRAAATREVLQMISQSSEDGGPVFEAIVRHIGRLCGAAGVALHLANEARTHAAYAAGWGDLVRSFEIGVSKWPLEGPMPLTRAIGQLQVINIPDLAADAFYRHRQPDRVAFVEKDGVRSLLVVPLAIDAQGIGCLEIYRREVRPFSDDEVALVESFAAQAVIAIENVRRFRGLQARLEREAVNRDILQLIRQIRDNEQPVFDAIVRSAVDLCDVQFCMLWRYDGTMIDYCASHGFSEEFMAEYRAEYPMVPRPGGVVHSVIRTGRTFHLPSAQIDAYYDGNVARQHGYDYMIGVPIDTNDGIWGVIVLGWPEGQSPRDGQVELLETYAAQAVIAIENARQFRDLQARLDRAAATREILEAIRDSREDEAPVLDVILCRAAQLCGADAAAMTLGKKGDECQRLAAAQDMHPRTRALYADGKVSMNPRTSLVARAIVSSRTLHVPDYADTDDYRAGDEVFRSLVDDTGMRTSINVPLLSGGEGIGALVLYRKTVSPYTPDQIALVETFATQAVIAIENVQQFRALESLNAELGERVERQVGEIERMGRLKQFLSPAVADALVTSGDESRLASHRALIATLFCDIRGFTAFCETAEPEETIEVLQAYHEDMGKLIGTHGAGVDKRMGDGIMVIFNDPLPRDNPAGDAVRLAVAMRHRMTELCGQWKRHGHRLGFGVGISLGYATIGMVGSEGRYDYTASGTSVNLAARLCDCANDGEILLSLRAYTAVEDEFEAESSGELSLKGIREPVEVFRLVGP